MTYFLCDMKAPGVEVRPLRQLTGEAEFNEVFLTDVRIPDSLRLGDVGEGWRVAQTTLMNERVVDRRRAAAARGRHDLALVTELWRSRPERAHARAAGRAAALLGGGRGGPARRRAAAPAARRRAARPGGLGAEAHLRPAQPGDHRPGAGAAAARRGCATTTGPCADPTEVDLVGRSAGFRYLRAKGNSIEGGTSEILRNIVAERVLGLPSEPRVDIDVPWKDLPK